MAVGWLPPDYSFEGPTDDLGWTFAQPPPADSSGDKIIPFLTKWRIGPVGTVVEVKAADAQWEPTVEKGAYDDELGRRILVTWEQTDMPPDGKVAIVPENQRLGGPLARQTIFELSEDKFQKLCAVLSDPTNWTDLPAVPGLQSETEGPPPPPVAEFSLSEGDLQKHLSRNLDQIEKGLKSDPDYQLEQYVTDVGRIDLLCKDAQGNWVVIELKADWAGDDAVGQIMGYMRWAKDNLPDGENVRGIIVCKNTTERVKAAIEWVPCLSVKQFTLKFEII